MDSVRDFLVMIIGKKIGIYKITNPVGAIYIGQSRDISKRRTSYRGISKKNQGQPKLYNSLRKYGAENHKFEVIQECELHELNIYERYWQEYYNVCSRENLNCTLTSIDETPSVVSEETRRKMSHVAKIRMKRLLKDPAYLATMEEVYKKQVGRKRPPATNEYRELRRKIEKEKGSWVGENNPWFGIDRSGENNSMYGRNQSEETRNKIRAKAIGRGHTDATKKKMSELNSGSNNCHAKLILNMDTGIFYDCGKEAWETLSQYAFSTFRSKMNGKIKKGLPFKYV